MDGGPEQWHNGAAYQIPVAGVGNHVVSCQAHNGAVDPTGQYAYSAPETWRLDIGEPTVSAVSFTKIVDALKCGRVRERITVPGRWVTVRRHHKLVKVHKRAHSKIVSVERCHARVVWRREKVWVKVRRHHKVVTVMRTRRVRVLLTPHTIAKTKERVAYGQGVTVSGWLGTAGGVAIGGTPVEILAAPNNGLGQFALVASTTTAANGAWSARLGPGPSRLVEVAYGGSNTLLPTISSAVQTVVPAKIRIRIAPRIVPWGSEIRITGQVLGGYVPTSSNLLRLNVGIGRIGQLEGLPEIQPDGHFVIVWKFNPGRGVLHPWFSVGTLAESAFPYAPGTSRRIVVTLGEPTPPLPSSITITRQRTHRKRKPEKAAQAAMIARHRGEERVHSRWRPAAATGVRARTLGPRTRGAARPGPVEAQLLDRPAAGLAPSARPDRWSPSWSRSRPSPPTSTTGRRPRPACRQPRGSGFSSGPPRRSRTPRGCASSSSPPRSPPHSRPTPAGPARPTSARSTSRSFRIRTCYRTVRPPSSKRNGSADGRRSGYFTLVLSHVRDGWQAIDIVPGASVRPR